MMVVVVTVMTSGGDGERDKCIGGCGRVVVDGRW